MELGKAKYIIWLVTTFFVMYAFSLNTASAVFSDAIKKSFNASDINVSLANCAFIFGYACMQIPGGYLLDKLNARFVVSFSIFLLAFGNFLLSFSTIISFFALANFVQGLGAAFAFIAAAVLISQWFPAKQFPIYFGLTQTLSCFSAGIVHYYLTIALSMYVWNLIYQCFALFGLVLGVLSLFIIKNPANIAKQKPLSLKSSVMEVLKNKQIILCSVAGAMSFGVILAYAGLWYMPVQVYYSVETLEAVEISGLIFMGLGIGTPLLGWISNQLKSRIIVLHTSLCIGTMGLLLCLYLPKFPLITLVVIKIISFFTGFFLSGSMLFYTMINEIARESVRGVAISVINTSVFLFNTFLLFIPFFFMKSGSTEFFTYLWLLPFCLLFSILLLSFIQNTYPENNIPSVH